MMILNHAIGATFEDYTVIKTEHMGDHIIKHIGSGILLIMEIEHRWSPVELSINNLADGFPLKYYDVQD